MPKLSQLQREDLTEKVTIDLEDGDSLNLVIYPNRITNKRQMAMEALDEEDEDYYDEFAELFFEIYESWDLTDDAGKVLPFNGETAELLSVPTMIRIGKAIGDTINPKPNRKSRRSRGR